MQSKAATVEKYLASLPSERREALEAVRAVFRKNLDKNIEEGMQYGMIGYYVPHRVFPAGYHCDPKQPLPYAGMASQKSHMSLYLMCVYGEDNDVRPWFLDAWKQTGKKLDMGKACIRFKKVEDLALDVIAETIRRVTAKKYIERYEQVLASGAKGRTAKTAASGATKAKRRASEEKGSSTARDAAKGRRKAGNAGRKAR